MADVKNRIKAVVSFFFAMCANFFWLSAGRNHDWVDLAANTIVMFWFIYAGFECESRYRASQKEQK